MALGADGTLYSATSGKQEISRYTLSPPGQETLVPGPAVGLGVPLGESVEGFVETFGSSVLSDFGDDATSSLEWLLGAKYHTTGGIYLGGAGGTGLLNGVGTPDVHLIASLGYLSPTAPPEAPPSDRDGDGIIDSDDACPDQAEDVDGFEDVHGCPDPDNDGDGIPDAEDQCPLDPEDMDGFEDEDGCPEEGSPNLDADGDGIEDAVDECVNEPEDKDGFQDEDGCPDPDNDKDGILDADDKCPLEPGTAEEKGCPKSVRVDSKAGTIRILQQIQFALNQDEILAASFPLMTELVSVLESHSEIKRVRIEGHTDDRGADQYNLELSKRRARSVAQWLIDKGIPTDRLEAWGCGESFPTADNTTAQGRAENRRVVFHILDPKPEAGNKIPSGCTNAPTE
jgi:outer membrane protein OmpA-like peptidoglycan-associated protein